MFNFSGSEIVFLLLLALIILGPEKLPDAVRKFGKGYAEFKKVTTGFQDELKSALDEPMREMRETADAFKQAATFDLKLDPNAPKPHKPQAPTGEVPSIAPLPALEPDPDAPAPDIAREEIADTTDAAAGPVTASPQGDDLGTSAE